MFGPNSLATMRLMSAFARSWIWSAWAPDVDAVLSEQFAPTGSDYYKVNDPALNRDFAEEYGTSSQSAQNQYAAAAQERILQEYYAVPVFQLTTIFATAKSVHGVGFGADSRLAQLTDAWVSGSGTVNG